MILVDLAAFFDKHRRVALALSGGVDSSYVLYAARMYGAEVRPYYLHTVFQPQFEQEDAQRVSAQMGIELTVLDYDILALPQVRVNGMERCYFCKRAMLAYLQQRAASDGYPVLLDGTNASDDDKERPGMRALKELGIRSPLRECGLTKSEIRQLSREAGLFTWDKPAYACLATRISTGVSITEQMLQQVEGAENALFQLGFFDVRVRIFHGAARLQLSEAQLSQIIEKRQKVLQRLRPYFSEILLDLEVRG